MKPKERIIAALNLKEPDELPISLSIGPTNAKMWLGKSDWRSVIKAHRMIGSIPEYGFPWYATTESNPVFGPDWETGWNEEVHFDKFAEECGEYTIKTRTITTPKGKLASQERIDYEEYVMGQTLEPLIKNREDYELYLEYIEEWLRVVERQDLPGQIAAMHKEIGDQGVWVTWRTHTFYSFFWVLRKVSEYLMDFYDDPGMMDRVMNITGKVNDKFLAYFNDSPSDIFIINLSGAPTSVISPDFFQKWVFPELVRMSRNIHPKKYLGFHLTGKMRDILPIMMEAEPDLILRFESPRFGGDISLREAKELYGDKVCIMGGYDPHIFVDHSLDEMISEAKRCVDEAAEGGGFILANTDAIPEDARLEDIREVVQFAKQYWKHK